MRYVNAQWWCAWSAVAFALASCSDGGGAATPPTSPTTPTPTPTSTPPSSSLVDGGVVAPAVRREASIEPEPRGMPHPPPISGGTLLVTRDGATAVAADPDFDRVYLVDMGSRVLAHTVALQPDDEPGRVAEDGAGRVHVALRRGGAVVTINSATGEITARREVCPAPRGLAWDAHGDVLYVACAGGELVTLPAAGGAATRTLHLARDLRDVVVVGSRVWVSRFRAAEVLVVGPDGVVERTMRPTWGTPGSEAVVAWRMVPYGAGAVMVHQRVGIAPPMMTSAGLVYSPPQPSCAMGMTPAQVTVFTPDALPITSPPVQFAVLPTDIAPTVDGTFAITAPGSGSSVVMLPAASIAASGPCVGEDSGWSVPSGQPVSIAVGRSVVVVQVREPPAVLVDDVVVPLSADRRDDEGHRLFHTATALHVACASCHPEGGDDGHVWSFPGQGLRRTPSLRGGVLATAPYHWDGSLADMPGLVSEVMVRRMGSETPSRKQVVALAHWLDALPLPAQSPAVDPDAVMRGAALFARPDVGCVSCHAGAILTNNTTVDVGTGAPFQVPSLRGVAWRAPYMHDGCAATLSDRFSACGGGERHGHTQQLTDAERGDLIAYLDTL